MQWYVLMPVTLSFSASLLFCFCNGVGCQILTKIATRSKLTLMRESAAGEVLFCLEIIFLRADGLFNQLG